MTVTKVGSRSELLNMTAAGIERGYREFIDRIFSSEIEALPICRFDIIDRMAIFSFVTNELKADCSASVLTIENNGEEYFESFDI